MADTDHRRDNRSYSGGGGRGYNNNKRKRFREDDDYDGSGGGYRNQRPRHQEPPPGTRIRRGLLEIAEDPSTLPHEVAATIAKLAADNYDDEYVKETFGAVTLKLVVEQPFKIPFVAAVVLYANADRPELAADVVNRAAPQLQEYIENGQWREAKLMLRFLACLSQLYEEDGIITILDDLFSRAVDLQTASADDTVGVELVKIILITIPYLLVSATDQSLQQKAFEMLEKTDIVASAANPLEHLVDPYPTNDQEEKPMLCQSVISLLQRQLQEEAANGWQLQCIPRVYFPDSIPKHENGDADDETNGNGGAKTYTKHAFPAVTVPSPLNAGSQVLFPEIFFSLYADQEIESVPATNNIAASLLRDAILDTINILDFNRNVVAKFLSELDCYWAPGTFVKRAMQFDKLRDVGEGMPTWKPEDVAIDAIFSQIFQLPAPEHRLVYYHSIITESCKISPSAIAPSLGRGIRFLFRNVELMDMELANRFMEWFAHHLSNFEFRWKWAEWVPDVDLPDLQPKKAFIKGALEKEVQLSFAKRVRATLPEAYHPLIPLSKDKEVPDFKFSDEQMPFAKEGREVLAMLRKKAPEDDIQTVLDSVHEQALAAGIKDTLVASTDIYMTSICSIGSKSLSHVLSTIDRCKDRLLQVGQQSEIARRQIISSVVDFWIDYPGTAVNILDKLLNYSIITPMSIIEWALHDHLDRGRALAQSQIYELASITMFKVTNRVRQVLRERNNVALPFAQRQQIEEQFAVEREGMRSLFTAIEDAVASVASGAQDEMIERYDGDSEERDLVMRWGTQWARVWRRKAAVEEATVGDAAIAPLEEPPVVEAAGASDDGVDDMDQVA